MQVHQVLAEIDLLRTGTTTTNGITTTNRTTCKERWTCLSCTEATMSGCSWFVAEQICKDNSAGTVRSPMVVTNGSSCPKFSVNNKVSADQTITVTVMIDDAVMGGGFVRLLANSSVQCQLDNNNYTAEMDGDRISCSTKSTRIPRYNTTCQQSVPHFDHLLIVFDGKLLRFDNVSDYYVTTYPLDGNCPKMECPHCHWNNGTHRFYCSWCLVNNATPADDITPYQYCDVRNISSLVHLSTTVIRDDKKCPGKDPIVNSYSVTPKTIIQSYQSLGCSQVDNNRFPVVPTVDDGQVFGGIESGGNTFRVHGKHFCGLRDIECCVRNKISCSNCNVQNDTLMICRSPKLNIRPENASEVEPLRFYAKNSTGIQMRVNATEVIRYRRYQDPVFTDFVVNGCCNVTINGLYPVQILAAEDLSIVLQVPGNSSPRCLDTWMDSTQIICRVSQSSLPQLGPLPKQIKVTFGENLKFVERTKQKYSHFKSSLATTLLPGVVTIGAYVSFIAVLCVALIFFKSSKDYDLLHLYGRQQLAEMRPLDERNLNDCDDNGEPENKLLVRDERH